MKLNIANLESYFTDSRSKDFAVFLSLKRLVARKSSCIYNYSPEKLALLMNVSPNTARSFVSRFIRYGWCRKHRGRYGRFKNLVFNSHIKSSQVIPNSLIINFRIVGGVSEIHDALHLTLLKVKQSQFNKIKQSAQDIISPTNLGAYKSAQRLLKKKKYGQLPDKNAKLQLSIKTIAKMFGCSVGKASQIISRFRKEGKIIVESCRQIVATFKDRKLAAAYLGEHPNCYYTGLHVIRVSCNYYQF